MTYRQKLMIAIRWQWRWCVLRHVAKDDAVKIWEAAQAVVICFAVCVGGLFYALIMPLLFLPKVLWMWSGYLLYASTVWDSKEFERLQKRMPKEAK